MDRCNMLTHHRSVLDNVVVEVVTVVPIVSNLFKKVGGWHSSDVSLAKGTHVKMAHAHTTPFMVGTTTIKKKLNF